jgi:hypothetical protein
MGQVIAKSLGCDEFDECIDAFSQLKLLICIDNIEELVGDDPGALEDFQLALPASWVVLLTSRVVVPAQHSAKLRPLDQEELGKIAVDRLVSHGYSGSDVDGISRKLSAAATSPLALVLAVDSVVVTGREVSRAIEHAETLTAEFAFSTLIGALGTESRRVLDAIHVCDEVADIDSVAQLLNSSRGALEEAVSLLRGANLVLPAMGGDENPLRLTPQVRELLARAPVSDLSRDQVFRTWKQLQSEVKRLLSAPVHALPMVESRVAARVSLLRLAERVNRCSEFDRTAKLALIDELREFESRFGESGNSAWLMSGVFGQLQDGASDASAQAERAFRLAPNSWLIRRRLALMKFDQEDFGGAADVLAPLVKSLGSEELPLNQHELREVFTRYFQARMFSLAGKKYECAATGKSSWASILEELREFNFLPLEVNRRFCLVVGLRRSVEREPSVVIRMDAFASALQIVVETFDEQNAVIASWTGEVQSILERCVHAAKQDAVACQAYRDLIASFVGRWSLPLTQRSREGVDMAYVLRDVEASFGLDSSRGVRADFSNRGVGAMSVEVTIYAPPIGREFCFGEDSVGRQYFIHRSSTRRDRTDFGRIRRGDQVLVVPDTDVDPGRAIRAISAELVSVQD